MIGNSISHYQILEKLGQGGMGEVYRAEDSILKREVAIKVLPGEFTRDPERLARFQREAQVLASLNHPNIAAIYGLEEDDGVRFLVLELVEGQTLAQRLTAGPLPVDESLEICLQMAEGLETAHESGVIHRDLKPANLMLTPDDKVKILDFGLAKALDVELSQQELANSPTITSEMSRAGVILGTAAYMSPEQARGKPVDKRADIWAFGCVLYECLTGRQLFGGETITDCIAKVLQKEPDWEALPEDTPWRLRDLLRRCLEKDPHDRLHHIADTRIEIERAQSEPADAVIAAGAATTRIAWARMVPFLVIVALVACLVTWFAARPGPAPPPPTSRFLMTLPTTPPLANRSWLDVAVSPDGTQIVYQGGDPWVLCLRWIDDLESRIIPGTEGGQVPFFSPDGKWVGFYDRGQGKLMKVRLSGGPATTITQTRPVYGAAWGTDGTIIFANSEGLFQLSAGGGKPPEQLREGAHFYPRFLPGGKAVLFCTGLTERAQVGVLSLETGEERILLLGTQPRYARSGHLVFAREGGLLAAPFDLEGRQVTGEAVSLVENVRWPYGRAVDYTFSETGTLVYVPQAQTETERTLVWVDREGREEPLAAEAKDYGRPRISPDGSRLVVPVRDSGNTDLWIHDLEHGTATRLTSHPAADGQPVWTPDSQRVVFMSNRHGGRSNLFWKAADGTSEVERLTTSPYWQEPYCFSPDGKQLVLKQSNPEKRSGGDLYVLSMEGENGSTPLLATRFKESQPALSPDGRWIAYLSPETGQGEIYVRPFPNVEDGVWRISTGGGVRCVWGPGGRELFYLNVTDRSMMVVPIQTEPAFSRGKPQLLFKKSYNPWYFDLSPDGQRFLIAREAEWAKEERSELIVVLNWFEELKRLVPTGN